MSNFEDIKVWQPMADAIGGELGKETVAAFQELYTLYTPDTVDWLANLYDCKTGGWYYSNSARDNETRMHNDKEYRLLPDAESTCQALGFLSGSGMLSDIESRSYKDALPEWMKQDIGAYVQGMQDPDGYFYHEQWGKEITVSRRARDLNWCTGMLRTLGVEKKYSTIFDKPAGKTTDETLVPEHLSSPEAFAEYLVKLDIPNRSYYSGNMLSAQSSQIRACGLFDQMIEYLNSIQHPETGIWHSKTDYEGINGLMKISGMYISSGTVMPNSIAAVNSAFDAVLSDEFVGTVTQLWNTWESVCRLITGLKKNGGDKGEELVAELRANIIKRAPEAIRGTKEKLEGFKKADAGFSYGRYKTSHTSQGMPVALPETAEGDVNATVIAVPYMVTSICSVFGLSPYKVPIYTPKDRERFISIIEANRAKLAKEN